MTSPDVATLEARRAAIQKERSARARRSLLGALATTQLLFAAFAFGHARGPVLLTPPELVLGSFLAVGLALAWAGLTQHRHLEAGASYHAVLNDGRRRYRLAIHDDYLTLEKEIVPLETIEYARIEGEQLMIRYQDPVGPVLRGLSGPEAVLKALARRLERRPVPLQA